MAAIWNVNPIFNIFLFLLLLLNVLYLSDRLGKEITILGNKLKIRASLLYGIILGVSFSLPEFFIALFTAILPDFRTEVLNTHRNVLDSVAQFITSDLIGSVWISLLLLVIGIFCLWKHIGDIKHSRLDVVNICLISACLIFILLGAIFSIFSIPFNIGFLNIASLVCLIAYIISCVFCGMEKETVGLHAIPHDATNQPKKYLIFKVSVTLTILVVSSFFINLSATELLTTNYGKEDAYIFAGGDFMISLLSSSPEIMVIISFIRKKNINGIIGDLLGSILFTLFTLSIMNFVLQDQNIFTPDVYRNDILFFILPCLASSLILLVLICINRYKKNFNIKRYKIVLYIFLSIILLLLILFITLNFIY